jgi:hypothetical protein
MTDAGSEVCFGHSSEVVYQLPFPRSCEDFILMSFTSQHFSYISGHNGTPNYTKIKTHNNSMASNHTCTKIHVLTIKVEIRFLYVKKQNIK